jgi:pyruvate formate lyase activating enzyme
MVSTGISGTIFNIQKFSVHDGPGIRTTVFMKGCPLQCRWCSNAESMSPDPEPGIIRERCDGCGDCVGVCPEEAVRLNDSIVMIDRSRCNACGACADICPTDAITIYGRNITVDEAFGEVLKDKTYYSGSDGGVTVSGGEPLRQAGFVKELFKRCKEEGIKTCLDTCGYASSENLAALLPYTDTILFDLKHMDDEKHRHFTGVSNGIIKENAVVAAKSDASILFRIPLIEGVNSTEDNIRETARFIESLEGEYSVEFLPYHRLGIGKYRTLDRQYPGTEFSTPSEEKMDTLKRIFVEYGIRCTVGG